ncbi:MAG: SAM-dependent methyltransferase [Verrucomicrobiota bacterium]
MSTATVLPSPTPSVPQPRVGTRVESPNFLDRCLTRDLLPDPLLRLGIRRLLRERLREENRGGVEAQRRHLQSLIETLRTSPIALETAAANEQHYEVPTRFYQLCLGPRLKYSSCLYPTGGETLAEAEEHMLTLTAERAQLADGQDVLELGCGWGSLTLWMAERFPRSRFTGVSNSRTQREFILAEAARRGLGNIEILTCDMNRFEPPTASGGTPDASTPCVGRFDRVVSVEMFEHMRNYEVLLGRISRWLKPEGRLFVHIFTHREYAYPFVARDASDWMARYFFTGGIMPSDDLLLYFQKDVDLVEHWTVNGRHYQQTAEHWLQNMDSHREEIRGIFAQTYGREEVTKWWVYWRLFYLACAELWGFRGGNEWLVSHYLFRPRPAS